MPAYPWVFDDGGRSASGRPAEAGDSVARCLAIVTGLPYREVYDQLAAAAFAHGWPRNLRRRLPREVVAPVYAKHGLHWHPTMYVGSGTQVHLAPGELPKGPVVAQVSRGLTCVVDDTIRDLWNPSRDGMRCVYGLYHRESS